MQLEREIKKKETELRRLKKSHQYPKLPVINAITIFAREQVKNCQRSPGLGSSVGFDIKEVYKQCHRDWKSMTQWEKMIANKKYWIFFKRAKEIVNFYFFVYKSIELFTKT